MATVLFSWLLMGAASLIFGKAIVDRVYRDDLEVMGKADVYMIAGMIFLNVYAQIFSFFDQVAGAACIFLFVAAVILAGRCLAACMRERKSLLKPGFLGGGVGSIQALPGSGGDIGNTGVDAAAAKPL